MTSLKGRRKLIGISALSGSAADTYPTLYERAQTKGRFDLGKYTLTTGKGVYGI